MNKNIKIIIFALVGLLVLGGVCAVLLLTQPKTETEDASETTSEEKVTDFAIIDREVDELKSISIKNTKDEYVVEIGTPKTTVTDEDGHDTVTDATYKIAAIEKAPFNQTYFSSLAMYSTELTAKTIVEKDVTDFAKYGLETPASEVTIYYSDGTATTLYVGDEAPTSSSTYVRLKDKNDVYNVSTYMLTYFLQNRYYYVNTTVMEAYDSETSPTVQRLTVERIDLDTPFVIEAIPELKDGESVYTFCSHTFKEPIEVLVEAEAGSKLIYGLYGLTASEAVWVGLEEKDYELAKLNTPTAVIKMQVGGKTYTLTIGAALGEDVTDESGSTSTKVTGYYGVFSEIPDVLYVFPAASLPWLTMDVDTYMSRLFMTPYIYALDTVTYTDAAGVEQVFKIEGDNDEQTFYLNGEKISDNDKVKTLYQFFISAYGEELYTEEWAGDFICSLTFKYRDSSKSDDVLKIYGSNDRKIILNVNGENIFKCRQLYATRLQANIEAFLNGGEIITDW